MNRDKLESVVLTMANHPDFVSDTFDAGNELYFRYKGHAFSVLRRGPDHDLGEYTLCAYPQWSGGSESLARALEQEPDREDISYVLYHLRDYPSVPFVKVWNTVKDQHNNMDLIFDDILRDVG